MTVQQVVDRARRLWYVDSFQYEDDDAVEDFNIIYHDLENDIVTKIREDYFWDYFTTDSVVWQTEYVLPSNIWNWWTELEKWDWVSVKYTNTSDFIKARRVNQNWLESDDTYYAESQSQSDPFYYIKDDSIFIFPAPDSAIIWWIKMEWIKWLSDLVLTSLEPEIFNDKIPTKFHTLISMWMLEYVYQSRWI